MKIDLYRTNEDSRKICKRLEKIEEKELKLLIPCDVHNPVVQIQKFENWNVVNYAFISQFNRFYFINKMKLIEGGRIELELTIDVLQTYASEILALSTMIERQEFVYNNFFIDSQMPIRQDRFIETEVVGTFPSTKNGNNFVLTTF